MPKKKQCALGKRLIASAKEMVAHAKGEIELDTYEIKVPSGVPRRNENSAAAGRRAPHAHTCR
jgi:hypothetical protein